MLIALAFAAALAYLAAVALRMQANADSRSTTVAAALALILHAAALGPQVLRDGELVLGVTQALSTFTWVAAALLWLLCLGARLQALGSVAYPLAGAAALWAAAAPSPVSGIGLADWKRHLHVVLSLLSAGFLTLAAIQSAALALQDRLLHHARSSRLLDAMPPLQTMEALLFRLVAAGFFLLTLSLVTGLLFIDDLLQQHLAHKTVFSVMAWLTFGGLLWGRRARGWRGRTAIRWSLAGYLALTLAYFGSKFVLEELLGKQWG